MNETAVLVDADGLEVIHAFAEAQAGEDGRLFVDAIGRHKDGDRFADDFVGGPAEDALRTGVPGLNDAVEILGDDGVVGGFDDGGEASLRRGAELWALLRGTWVRSSACFRVA